MRWRLVQHAAIAAAAAALAVLGSLALPATLADLARRGYVVTDARFLWGLLVIPALLAVRVHTLSDLPRLQQALSVLLRAGVVACVVLALVGVERVRREPRRTSTVFAIDVSESVPDAAIAAARAHVAEAWRRRGEHEVRVVAFARDAVEVPLPRPHRAEAGAAAGATSGADEPFPEIPRMPARSGAPGDARAGQETNIQAALRLAFSLLPEERLPRVVLATDGLETQGAVAAELETAARFGVPVHYLDLSDTPRPGELMVTGLEAPPRGLQPGVPFTVTGTLKATRPMAAECALAVDGERVASQVVHLEAGDEAVRLEARVEAGGERRLQLTCTPAEPSDDRFASNNRYAIVARVAEKPRVLYVEGEPGAARSLVRALGEDFDVELRGPGGVPSTAAEAERYDVVFVSDVPRLGRMDYPNVSDAQMRALAAYARAGGGLVFAGGADSLGPGGYGGTLLEREVLPVRLDVQKKEDIPTLALMLVIDRSGSMSGPKIELAKEAARATLEVLQPSDKLGIVAFDATPTMVVRLQRASNRLKITDSLSRLSPGGGTSIFPALDMAYQALAATEARVKHIILLTDGQSGRAGILELVSMSYQDKITISTVAVGLGADTGLLMQIAEEGGGRYYFTDKADNIPKLFLKEASQVGRRAVVEERFRPRVERRFRGLQMWRGLDMRRLPPLVGYVSTRAKPRAEVLMTSHLGEPILARWRLGLGRVVVWTSDVKNRWAHYWLSWPGFAKLWRQILRDTMRVERPRPTLDVHTDIAQGVLTVGIDAVDQEDRFLDALDSQVVLTGPDGAEHPLALAQTAAGRYEGRLTLGAYGPYAIRGRHTRPDAPDAEPFESYATVAWPFPAEHLAGAPDLSVIERLADASGGVRDPTPAVLFDPGGATTEHREPLWPLPLYPALVLVLLDVLLRRVRLYGRTAISWEDVRG